MRELVRKEIKDRGLNGKQSLEVVKRLTRQVYESESDEVKAEIVALAEELAASEPAAPEASQATPEAYHEYVYSTSLYLCLIVL